MTHAKARKEGAASAQVALAPLAEPPDVPAVLSHVVARQLDAFSTILPRVLTGDDPDDVHDLRVCTRRLQETLAVLSSPSPSRAAERERRTLRRVRRALGSWRNLDVVLAKVGDRRRATRSAVKRAGWGLVRDTLAKRRVDETLRARKRLVRESLGDFPAEVSALGARLLGDSSPSAAWQAVRERVEDAWNAWNDALSRASETPGLDTVHALRIATKRLRYRVELARELDPQGAEPVLEWTRRLQKDLGDWHDRQVFRQLVAESLARPQVLLDHLPMARAVLDELEGGRRPAPPDDSAPLARIAAEEGRAAFETWLARARERI
ncbi:MAG: CHAD domain-containing protein [Deltaproteobacteria bacterium]|nr:CHAD domain-containing protein [Deltaproteobacteria bacterium]